MIWTRLHGGMGNQLFQYAAGRALAARLGAELAIDARALAVKGNRPCGPHFAWNGRTDAPLPPARHEGLLRHGLWRLAGRNPRFRRERGLGYNPAFETWGDGSYLHGYWQSERYFAPIAQSLRRELEILTPPSPRNAEMAARISGCEAAVSLHVRRGDYLAYAAHTICTEGYYRAALAQVAKVTGIRPTVFVFSDDPDWAKANLPLPYEKVVIDFNGPEADYEDLRLMSLCRHNVIANSSFSWWAAWLNRNPAKVVAGPVAWFGDPKLSNPDILPPGWLRVAG